MICAQQCDVMVRMHMSCRGGGGVVPPQQGPHVHDSMRPSRLRRARPNKHQMLSLQRVMHLTFLSLSFAPSTFLPFDSQFNEELQLALSSASLASHLAMPVAMQTPVGRMNMISIRSKVNTTAAHPPEGHFVCSDLLPSPKKLISTRLYNGNQSLVTQLVCSH